MISSYVYDLALTNAPFHTIPKDAGWLTRFRQRRAEKKRENGTLKALAPLSDEMLKDIGVAHGDVPRLARPYTFYPGIEHRWPI